MNKGYRWNPDSMTRVFALPADVDKHMRLAGALQLKVLLWLVCRGEGVFDAEVCAAAVGKPAADCADAFDYWLEAGLLMPAGEGPASTAPPAGEPAAPAVPAVTAAPAAEPKPAPVPRPQTVKPDFQDVLARQKDSAEFAYLLDTASARFGRPISHADMQTLLYLYDTAGIPAELILMVIAYAVSKGKPNMRYVEKVALDWLDQGIDTIGAAEEYLCRLERREEAGARIKALLVLERPLTVAQTEKAEKWLHEWKVSDALIQLAARLCQTKKGEFNFSYVDKVLESWRLDGIDTPEKARALAEKSRAKPAATPVENSSLDLDEYERWLVDYVPVYKKKNGKQGERNGL